MLFLWMYRKRWKRVRPARGRRQITLGSLLRWYSHKCRYLSKQELRQMLALFHVSVAV